MSERNRELEAINGWQAAEDLERQLRAALMAWLDWEESDDSCPNRDCTVCEDKYEAAQRLTREVLFGDANARVYRAGDGTIGVI